MIKVPDRWIWQVRHFLAVSDLTKKILSLSLCLNCMHVEVQPQVSHQFHYDTWSLFLCFSTIKLTMQYLSFHVLVLEAITHLY